jgi:hypothetical protein
VEARDEPKWEVLTSMSWLSDAWYKDVMSKIGTWVPVSLISTYLPFLLQHDKEEEEHTQKASNMKSSPHLHPIHRIRQHSLRMRVNHTLYIRKAFVYLAVDKALLIPLFGL